MNMSIIKNEDSPTYNGALKNTDDDYIEQAKRILKKRFQRSSAINNPQTIKDYLILHYSTVQREVFSVVSLDAQHRVISIRELFLGTINSSGVHPREVVKAALADNANSVIFAHNHPSGIPEPSQADKSITEKLKNALDLVEINVLDHIIVGGGNAFSFAESGLM